jgi:polar amino acid transport system substrate-binding protein
VGLTGFLRLAAAAAMLVCGSPADAQSVSEKTRVVRLSSLEWPPYTGSKLPQQGATTAVVRAALASMGYRLEVEFFPWSRAVAQARHPSPFIGYFPEYSSPQVEQDFLLSAPIGSGPLGFAQLADSGIRWQSLDDLQAHRIGIVLGYVNSVQFDMRVAQGLQRVDLAPDDVHNLLKLAARRISLATIDQRVFDYLVKHDPAIRAVGKQLSFNARILEDKKLFICFRRGPEGDRVRKLIDEGLKKIDVAEVAARALR